MNRTILTNFPRPILALVFCVLLYLFVEKRGLISNLFNNNFSVVLGKYGHAIYCCYETFTRDYFLQWKVYEKIGLNGNLQKFGIIVSSVILGIVLYHLIEKPIGDYLNKKLISSQQN